MTLIDLLFPSDAVVPDLPVVVAAGKLFTGQVIRSWCPLWNTIRLTLFSLCILSLAFLVFLLLCLSPVLDYTVAWPTMPSKIVRSQQQQNVREVHVVFKSLWSKGGRFSSFFFRENAQIKRKSSRHRLRHCVWFATEALLKWWLYELQPKLSERALL